MKLNLYSVRDRVLEEFGPLQESKNDGDALRKFEKVVSDQEFADDYVLYRVGSFDHSLGTGVFLAEPVKVVPTVSTDEEEE